MQYALPIDGYAAEYNDDIEFFVACYQHSDDPLQAFIRREIEVLEESEETYYCDVCGHDYFVDEPCIQH